MLHFESRTTHHLPLASSELLYSDMCCFSWFLHRLRDAYEYFLERNKEPEIAQRIAQDELNLFDRSATRMFSVEVRSQ